MALRDQPYIPLYIQDFLTDEKLIECSAKATGVYVRLMCIMHKSEEYGKILLKQKDKQSTDQVKNFGCKLAKQMPYDVEIVTDAIGELLAESVIHIEGDFLCQKRMIKDNALSLTRAKAGKKGGEFAQAKIKAKPQANTEYESEYENESEIGLKPKKEESNDFEENWKRWGDQIIKDNDQYWQKMRGRKVDQEEMDIFYSVAVRNGWKMETQQNFRISLHGFSPNGKLGKNGTNKVKLTPLEGV